MVNVFRTADQEKVSSSDSVQTTEVSLLTILLKRMAVSSADCDGRVICASRAGHEVRRTMFPVESASWSLTNQVMESLREKIVTVESKCAKARLVAFTLIESSATTTGCAFHGKEMADSEGELIESTPAPVLRFTVILN
jgi:hypothetical protein